MHRLTSWFAAVCVGMAAWPVAAQVQDSPVVVELFTSQGCASCPPADAILSELSERDDVIPLALHVDYWDYIGWKDAFASPAFTKRQKGYARANGKRSIYTPQMVVNGRFDVVGNRPMKVIQAIHEAGEMPSPVALTLTREAGELVIHAEPRAPLPPLTVHLVSYLPQEQVDIADGENAGLSITYSNIVQSWQVLGEWDGHAPLDLRVPSEGPAPVVVLMQEPPYGPILAAARLR